MGSISVNIAKGNLREKRGGYRVSKPTLTFPPAPATLSGVLTYSLGGLSAEQPTYTESGSMLNTIRYQRRSSEVDAGLLQDYHRARERLERTVKDARAQFRRARDLRKARLRLELTARKRYGFYKKSVWKVVGYRKKVLTWREVKRPYWRKVYYLSRPGSGIRRVLGTGRPQQVPKGYELRYYKKLEYKTRKVPAKYATVPRIVRTVELRPIIRNGSEFRYKLDRARYTALYGEWLKAYGYQFWLAQCGYAEALAAFQEASAKVRKFRFKECIAESRCVLVDAPPERVFKPYSRIDRSTLLRQGYHWSGVWEGDEERPTFALACLLTASLSYLPDSGTPTTSSWESSMTANTSFDLVGSDVELPESSAQPTFVYEEGCSHTNEEISSALDSGISKVEVLDFQDPVLKGFNLARAVAEQKDTPGTLKSIKDLARKATKPILGSKAALRGVSQFYLANRDRPLTSAEVRLLSKLHIPTPKGVRVALLTIQQVASLYLLWKWGVSPTIDDVRIICRTTWKALTDMRGGLRTMVTKAEATQARTQTVSTRVRMPTKSNWCKPADSTSTVASVTRYVRYRAFLHGREAVEYLRAPARRHPELDGQVYFDAACTRSAGLLLPLPVEWQLDFGVKGSLWERYDEVAFKSLSVGLPSVYHFAQRAEDVKLFAQYSVADLQDFLATSFSAGTTLRSEAERCLTETKGLKVAWEITPFSWLAGWLVNTTDVATAIQRAFDRTQMPLGPTGQTWGSMRTRIYLGAEHRDYIHTRQITAVGTPETQQLRSDLANVTYRYVGYNTIRITDTLQSVPRRGEIPLLPTTAWRYSRGPTEYQAHDLMLRPRLALNADKLTALAAVLVGFVR